MPTSRLCPPGSPQTWLLAGRTCQRLHHCCYSSAAAGRPPCRRRFSCCWQCARGLRGRPAALCTPRRGSACVDGSTWSCTVADHAPSHHSTALTLQDFDECGVTASVKPYSLCRAGLHLHPWVALPCVSLPQNPQTLTPKPVLLLLCCCCCAVAGYCCCPVLSNQQYGCPVLVRRMIATH